MMKTPEDDAEDLEPGDEAPPDEPSAGENICPWCKGTGTVDGEQCAHCGGSGKIVEAIGGG